MSIPCIAAPRNSLGSTPRTFPGFTLVELLVVVAVISILIALLIPRLKEARETARKTVCASNMHQVGTTLQGYLADYDNIMPYIQTSPPHASNAFGAVTMPPIQEMFFAYMNSYRNWICPTDTAPLNYQWLHVDTATSPACRYGSSYMFSEFAYFGLNYWPTGVGPPAPYVSGGGRAFNVNEIVSPGSFGYMSEGNWIVAGSGGWRNFGGSRILYNHNRTLNFLLVDGHVESFEQKANIAFWNIMRSDPVTLGGY